MEKLTESEIYIIDSLFERKQIDKQRLIKAKRLKTFIIQELERQKLLQMEYLVYQTLHLGQEMKLLINLKPQNFKTSYLD